MDPIDPQTPLILTAKSPAPPAQLAALAAPLAALTDVTATVVAFPATDESRKVLAKRRHDVKAALRTWGFTVKALESGYRFDDAMAKAKIDAIAKALAVLERESALLSVILGAD
jgi:hypothetical protein